MRNAARVRKMRRMAPRTADAAVMTDFNRPLAVRAYPLPDALGPGDILVRVALAGVCGTDVHLHAGQLDVPLPLIMGHETVGTIERIGAPPD
ncbi:MAG: alcohol dehydrogenase catalytic domain-containing protein, partial [Phycisphaerae bacterium]